MSTIHFQKLEGAFVFLASIAGFIAAGGGLWLYIVLILAPDISIAAYAINNRAGALAYNAVHNFAGPAVLLLAGFTLSSELLYQLSAIWAGHVGMDRMFGFGLKEDNGFHSTHLGKIGKN